MTRRQITAAAVAASMEAESIRPRTPVELGNLRRIARSAVAHAEALRWEAWEQNQRKEEQKC